MITMASIQAMDSYQDKSVADIASLLNNSCEELMLKSILLG